MKVLVLYVFHELQDRVRAFLKHAVFEAPDVDFVLVCNNKSLNVEVPSYVKILYRDNIGFDFGGWSYALLTKDLYKEYTHFVFANSSVIGPFLKKKERWTDIFLARLTESVRLVGPTINTCSGYKDPKQFAHVQSYFFVMALNTLEFLIQKEIFSLSNLALTFQDAIWEKEVRMSRVLVNNQWNIGCLLDWYHGLDFTFQTSCDTRVLLDDIMYHEYRNVFWDEYNLVFIKGNRVPLDYQTILQSTSDA